ncbi:SpoIIE family protein phosphatase [Sphaerisporangium sp. B11E5]|uniref:SpoIIE family protein phosphatase n=1 Tax=Sphaerisporangium sp. B11E5 TaxID=3153563 RepID=UPI00325E667B
MAARNVRTERHAEQPQAEQLGVVGTLDERQWSAQTLTLALQQATTGLGGLGALVHRRDSATGCLRLAAASGLLHETAETWAVLPTVQDVAPTRAMRCGGYVWVGGDSLGIGAGGTAALPLPGADGPVGVLSVLTAGSAEPDDEQQSFLGAIAAWAAARLEGLPGMAPGLTSAAGSERTVRMGELTAALAEAVTTRDVVQAVAEHVLPPFRADGLVVWLIECGRLDVVGAAGYPQEFLNLVDRLPLTRTTPVTDVLGTGTPRFIGSLAEYGRRYPTMKSVAEASPRNAWAFLPMIASGRSIGSCVVSFTLERVFSDEERTLLTALSGLVGQALERARLYDVEHARAQELQRGLLPRELPRLPVACAAARYLPAGRGEEVGGDWYDLIPLSGGRVAMVIGDVMGHGITEAATMGRLRTAVRTLADLDLPPDELIGHLNDLVSDLGDDFYATCLYAVFDPTTRTCTLCLAGHPPPVIVHPDGTVLCPHLTADPPLGAAEPPFEIHELHLPEESLLVLCTDGLVESATRDVDHGLAQLRRILAQAVPRIPHLWSGCQGDDVERLEDLCDTVVSALLPAREQTDDDAALFIAHTRGIAADDVATCDLPDDPRAAGQARKYVRKQLAIWGLDDLTVTTELLVSELVGNVIRHAKGPMRLRLLRSRFLICEVYDGSLSTPRIRHTSYTDEGGRGLQLVAALSRRWGARYLHDGKCLWTEQSLPADDNAKRALG